MGMESAVGNNLEFLTAARSMGPGALAALLTILSATALLFLCLLQLFLGSCPASGTEVSCFVVFLLSAGRWWRCCWSCG